MSTQDDRSKRDFMHFPFRQCVEKSSNKLRMKALVGWNILFQVSKLINVIVFFTRMKNDLDKEDKIAKLHGT